MKMVIIVNKKTKDIIELVGLGLILLFLIFLLFLSGYKIKKNNTDKTDSNLSNEQTEIIDKHENNILNNNGNNDNQSDNINNNIPSDNINSNNKLDSTDSTDKENINNSNTPIVDNDEDSIVDVGESKGESEKEEDIVNYVMTLNNELDTYKNEDNPTFREKAKNIFVTVVDFLFYDKEIKGYKFKDLTYETKLKVLKICASIDNKIDEYFPNYKDKIKSGYENIKGKIAVKYLEYTSKLCDKIGEANCSEFRTDFNNMKQSFGYTFSIIKEVASNASVKLVDILSEWYKSIK